MNKFLGVPYFVWFTICILIAVLYFIFVPKKEAVAESPLLTQFIIKYAHSIVWLLLAIACLAANYNWKISAKYISLTALLTYLIFIITFFSVNGKK